MRILFVARRAPPDVPTGRGAALLRLAARARERHDVRLIAGWVRSRDEIPPEALGIALQGLGPGWAHLALLRGMRQEIARFAPDVVVVSTPDVPWVAVPTVAAIRDLHEIGAPQPEGWRATLYRARMRAFRRIVAPTPTVRAELVRAGLRRTRVEVIPDGLTLPALARRPAGERLELVLAGRIDPAKGQHLAIDAVARLTADEKRRVRLRVVGEVHDQVYADQLKIAAAGHPVELAFGAPDLGQAFAAADVALYPSCLSEGFADIPVSAMAAGCPVIWSDFPGIRETTGGTGIPVVPADVESLRAAIRRCLRGEVSLAALGAAARAEAGRYAWDQVWPRWESVLALAIRR